MEYQEFKSMIQERLQAIVGEQVEVEIESFYKNNQTRVESLTFKEKNPISKITFSPAIHLQDIYRLYILHGDGEELADCLRQIQRLWEGQNPKSMEDILNNWGEIKGKITVNLIHKAWNEKWLREEQVPYKEYLDFAIILRRIMGVSPRGIATMVIKEEMLDSWKIDEEQLWRAAWCNLNEEEFYIRYLDEEIALEYEERGQSGKPLDIQEKLPLYIMSNRIRTFGAKAILRTDLLQKFAEEMERNLFILPSSVHEIIIAPDNGNYEIQELRKSVREINAECVAKNEWLSDEVYYFRKDSSTVEMAK